MSGKGYKIKTGKELFKVWAEGMQKPSHEEWVADSTAFREKFLVIYQNNIQATYEQYEPAVRFAVANFPQGGYIIRKLSDFDSSSNK